MLLFMFPLPTSKYGHVRVLTPRAIGRTAGKKLLWHDLLGADTVAAYRTEPSEGSDSRYGREFWGTKAAQGRCWEVSKSHSWTVAVGGSGG